MTSTQATAIGQARLSEIIRDIEEQYEEKVAELEERLDAANAKIRELEVDRELDVILRTRDAQEQLAQAYGENIELLRNYELACAERDEAQADGAVLRRENAELKSRDRRLTADAERLAAEKAVAETERDAALYKNYQLEADAQADRCLIPEYRVCTRCGLSDTEHLKGGGFYCRKCGDEYDPYPSRG